MAVRFDASGEYLSRLTGPSTASYSKTFWARKRGVSGTHAFIAHLHEGGSDYHALYAAGGTNIIIETLLGSSPTLVPLVTDTWYFFLMTYGGGTLTAKYLVAGDSVFASSQQLTGLTNFAAFDEIDLSVPGPNWFNGEVASVKLWSGVVLSDANALAERLYRNPQTNLGSVWATYQIKSGALGTDSSGNGRTLTENGTLAFVADPSDILGDSPSSAPMFRGV